MDKKDEEKIQELIREKVLEEYRKRESAEEIKLQAEATIDALHEVTGIPKDEVLKIADGVRQQYEKDHHRNTGVFRRPRGIKRYLPLILFLLALTFFLFRSPFIRRHFATEVNPMKRHLFERGSSPLQVEEGDNTGRQDSRRRFKRRRPGNH